MILIIFRDPQRGGNSVEEIYNGIMNELKNQLELDVYYYDDRKSILQNIRNIKRRGPKLIHITSDIYFILPFIKGCKSIITVHDIGRYHELQGIKKIIYKWLWFKLPLRYADKVITVSDFTLNDLKHQFGEKITSKSVRIYNPLSDIFKPVPKSLISEVPTILQVGTVINKKIENTILALADIPCHLVIIGKLTTDQIDLLRSKQIIYKNYLGITHDEVYQLYVNSDIVTFISSFEGFGMPIIEANATGRPIICSSTSSLPEIANDAALYVEDENSVEEIRSKILMLIKDESLRKKLIQNGYQNIKRFAMKEIAKQYLDVYRSV